MSGEQTHEEGPRTGEVPAPVGDADGFFAVGIGNHNGSPMIVLALGGGSKMMLGVDEARYLADQLYDTTEFLSFKNTGALSS